MDLETGNSQGQDRTDAALEADISAAYLRLIDAKTPEARRQAFEDGRRLQQRRSQVQVDKMESERGIGSSDK